MGNAMANTQLMNTYAEILKSRSVIVPVIEKTEEPNKEGKFPAYEGYIKGKVATAPFKDTEIMQLTVRANTAEKAQKANSLIVEGFLNRLTELSRDQQKATRGFIEERTATAKKELKDAEDKLTEYKKANDIIAPDDAVKLATEKMGMVDKLNAENRVALATANARLASTNAQLNGEAASIADNKSIQLYNTQLAQLEGERISYLDKYTAQHPKVKQVEQEIANLKKKINSEINKVASLQAPSDNPVHQQLLAAKFTSEAEASVAQSNLAKLAQIDSDNKADIRNLSDKEQEFVSLMRDVTVANEIYVMLAKRLEEAKVAEASVATEVQVVDTATLPTAPVAPKKAMTLLLAALLGILASSGFVVVRELLNRTIKNTDDVASYLDLPVLGSVPDMNDLRKDMEKNDKGPGLLAKIWRNVWKA